VRRRSRRMPKRVAEHGHSHSDSRHETIHAAARIRRGRRAAAARNRRGKREAAGRSRRARERHTSA
jgi:hypothetical protein